MASKVNGNFGTSLSEDPPGNLIISGGVLSVPASRDCVLWVPMWDFHGSDFFPLVQQMFNRIGI